MSGKVQMNWSDEQDFERDLANYGEQGLGELLDDVLGQMTGERPVVTWVSIRDKVAECLGHYKFTIVDKEEGDNEHGERCTMCSVHHNSGKRDGTCQVIINHVTDEVWAEL